jgi:hypothetical protein
MFVVFNTQEAIIIGGGLSILPYISSLQPLCANKFVITCNYAYKHFLSTFLAFQDKNFYVPDYAKNYVDDTDIRHPDIYNELKKLPLIVGIDHNGVSEFKLNNTILLNKSYRANLTGILALKLAEKIVKNGRIFLCGFDFDRRTGLPEKDQNYNPKSDLQIHYYSKEEINHPGQGRFGYFENHNPDKEFSKHLKKDIKIYNVSPNSNINCFEKISYEQMFALLSKEIVNQNDLRNQIRSILCTL